MIKLSQEYQKFFFSKPRKSMFQVTVLCRFVVNFANKTLVSRASEVLHQILIWVALAIGLRWIRVLADLLYHCVRDQTILLGFSSA